VNISPETLDWLRQSAAVDGSAYSQVLLHLLERVEALEHPTPEAAPVATDGELLKLWIEVDGCAAKARRACYDLGRQHGAAAAQSAPPVAPVGALAARALLERVAAMADRIGAQTVGDITTIGNRAAAWLRDNPPGQPVAIEPRGCPAPGACSCMEPAPSVAPAGGLVERVVTVIADPDGPAELWHDDARAAIREVAAWLRENETGYNAARLLEQDADLA
jgi:hypothetical protein